MSQTEIQRLETLEREVSNSKEQRAQIQGAIAELNKQLASQGLKSLEEAEEKIASLGEELDTLTKERDDLYSKIRNDYGWES